MSTTAMKLETKNSGKNQKQIAPSRRAKYRSGFTTLPPMLLHEQPTVVLLLERAFVSWSLAMDEHGEHEDFCGSGHRSIIPYAHGRMELYCSSLTLPV
jgi:hypothetical protein